MSHHESVVLLASVAASIPPTTSSKPRVMPKDSKRPRRNRPDPYTTSETPMPTGGNSPQKHRSESLPHTDSTNAITARAGTQGAGYFKDAHHFTIVDSVFMSGTTYETEVRAMQHLAAYVLTGAEFNSSARDPPPRCHEKTRITLFDKIQGWFNSGTREESVLWLHGPAGVGKSAILQTIAEREHLAILAATLFFSRPNQRNDPTKVLPSIAYQIATWNDQYRAYIAKELASDPLLPTKNIDEQFRAFVIEPIANRNLLGGEDRYFILLDALDECAGKGVPSSSHEARRSSEEAQVNIIRLVAGFAMDHPATPLIWVISSRPEEHLLVAFSHYQDKPSFWELHVPIDDKEAREDVRRYLVDGFGTIRNRFRHYFPPSWPSEHDFEKVVEAASGLFVFGDTVLRFIGDPSRNPVSQLKVVLTVIDGSMVELHQNPFATLDALYARIVSSTPADVLADTHNLLGHLLLRESFFAHLSLFGYSLYSVANVLGLQQHAVYGALSQLHSVLYVPQPDRAHKENIRFLHASFSDYLKDAGRSKEHTIDLPPVNTYIWKCYSRIIRQVSTNTDLRLRMAPQMAISMSWTLMGGSKYEKQAFASGLLYEAQYHWAHFLIPDCPCNILPSSGALGTVLLTPQERLDALYGVNFRELITGYFVESSDHIGPFFTSLYNLWQSSREELEKSGVIEETRIEEFSTDSIDIDILATTDQAICVEKKTDLQKATYKTISSWSIREMLMEEVVDEVCSLRSQSPQTPVLICGSQPSKKGALIILSGETNQIVYYYLPLR